MARIGIDATAAIHGERAVRRNTRNLLRHLVSQPGDDHWALLYLGRGAKSLERPALSDNGSWSETVCPVPMRALVASWRLLGRPTAESWLGSLDLLYAPDLYFPPTRRAPVVSTIRGVAYLAVPELCEPHHVRQLVKAFTYARRHAQHFLAVSESTRADLARYTDLPPERIHVVSHGVDPVFRQLDPAHCRRTLQRRFQLERPFFLYVGVVARHKNVPGLLEAMALVARKIPRVDLVLAGPFGSLITEARETVSRYGLAERVRFLGPVDPEGEDLVCLYNAALALVFPSFYEGWCAPPLEAMACGTPVLASEVPAVREVVGPAGPLLPPSDAAAWATAMVRVAEDESWRAQLSDRGRQHVEQHTWHRASRRLRRVFADILGEQC
jgi:glycosyltransferase involved in cell wall biosynthesis